VWCAPLWVVERAVCIWVALAFRLAGGVPYAGTRLGTAAHSEAELQRRHSGKLATMRRQDIQPSASNRDQEQP
jgi:hypothetical protein